MNEETFIEFWLRDATQILVRYLVIAGSAFILFYILFKNTLWFRKIQKKLPKLKDYKRDIIYSFISISIFATIALFVFYYLLPYTNIYFNFDEYGTTYYILSWVWMFFLHDTYFYWMHRLMHHPKLYRKVHLIHHKSTNPSPWTAYAFHPFEAFLEALIAPLIAFTLPVHISSFGLFFLFQIIYNVYGHLGFELYPKKFHKTSIGKWINTSVAHNLHHKRFNGNYGLYFLFWDRIMGTIRDDYDTTFENTTSNKNNN
ncbi:sterol desaturase family protein [Tenacibaculum aiptasiae]|uniref:sterol desaturase family protein n=1 Tax=Tenacibaculum aiptasiae TaxID=426481 RepID=UPI00232AF18C|nr:sterol desaturase family protein [Tenacibaculum aiptasiae]